MSSNSFTEKDKQLCFRFAFNANYTRQQAFALAQHSFPQAVYEEVDRAYNEFNFEKTKKCELNRQSQPSHTINRASLEGIPPELLEEILQNSSSVDQKNLHKTSYGLSSYIEKSFKTYETIQIYLDQETIKAQFDEQKPTVTRKIGEKRKLDEDEEATVQTSFHKIPDLIQHLETIFNERNVKVQKLVIKSAEKNNMEERKSEMFSGLQKVFEEMNNKIYVGNLEITVPTVEFLMSVLEKVKIGHLTHLTIHKSSDASLDFSVVTNSPHWSHIHHFSSFGIDVTVSFDQVYHMKDVYFINTAITFEDILKLRDKLVQNPKEVMINFKISHLNFLNLVESLKPCLPSEDLSKEHSGVYQCANKWKLNFSAYKITKRLRFDCVASRG